MINAIIETNIPGLKLKNRGKVRDIYDLGDNLLIVATDRISTFDVVLPTPIPGKGEVLTKMSRFWLKRTEHIVDNQLCNIDVKDVVKDKEWLAKIGERGMVVKKAKPLAVEAIVRGYLSGSGWNDYKKTGAVCGVALPKGLLESSKLPQTIFTPSTKAEIGLHDENIPFGASENIIGKEVAQKVRDLAIRIYDESAAYALERGIIIADTKFEFGILNDELILIDEVLTPDSSRFWPADGYKAGRSQNSFDKQFVRDWLVGIGWDKKPPAPALPENVVAKTAEKYNEALVRLTATR